jgi:hypothetical protein
MSLRTERGSGQEKPKTGPACVGVFVSVRAARNAVEMLRAMGVRNDSISVFTPNSPEELLAYVKTSDTEQGGMGAAMAGSIFGALGLGLGIVLFVPVIGTVSVLGALASGLVGAGSAAAGAAVGSYLERKSLAGLLPADEIYVYEDALARGRSIVLVTPDSDRAEETLEVLKSAGAETIDAARESWWVGLRDWYEANYQAPEPAVLWDNPLCRIGFEAALRHDALGKSETEGKAELADENPGAAHDDALWIGYSEGRAYARARRAQLRSPKRSTHHHGPGESAA